MEEVYFLRVHTWRERNPPPPRKAKHLEAFLYVTSYATLEVKEIEHGLLVVARKEYK